MRDSIRITPIGKKNQDGWTNLEWQIQTPQREAQILRYSLPEEMGHLFCDPEQCDAPIATSLHLAMELGLNVLVDGKVCPDLLDGLEQLQQIWGRWFPAKCKPVKISAREEISHKAADDNLSAVFAFSGGVDGAYSLFHHLLDDGFRNRKKPQAALLIQGFDVPLDKEDIFQGAAQLARQQLADTHVPLLQMKTNSRTISQDWHKSHGLQIAACFLTLQGQYSHALLGSTEPYEKLMMPWGSTPLTDPLSSSRAMSIHHDGCEVDRTQKIEWLATHTNACESLRVCWEGARKDRNCGKCEKCTRTMLNFWAAKRGLPKVFPTHVTPKKIRTIKLRSQLQVNEIASILEHGLRRYGRNDPIVKALEIRLGQRGIKGVIRRAANFARQAIQS
jgi:hypothetical protein